VANIDGKAYGFTAFTPMKRWKTPFLRLFFWSVPIISTPIIQKLFSWVTLVRSQKLLLELSFIHFARWSIVRHDSWPHLSSQQPKDKTRYDYLLFTSNFNGTWEQYIDAFSAVIPQGMNMIWRWSEQFPGARPITPFLGYIRRVQTDCEYYYGAYPGATASDVRQALHLRSELEAFAARTANMDAAQFAREYRSFLVSVQNCLGSTGLDPYLVDWEELLFPAQTKPEDLGPRGLNTPVAVSNIPDGASIAGASSHA
jgi:hypothetical protein